jgi:hypothetical protein
VHRLPSGDALWEGILGGTVRTAATIAGQPVEVQAEIRAAFERRIRPYVASDGLALPVSVKLASGRRPPVRAS